MDRPAVANSTSRLRAALSGFVPMLLVGLAACWLHGLAQVASLLVAQALALLGASGALGGRRPLHWRDHLRRALLQGLFLAGFAAWAWVLTMWPLAALARTPSLGASLLLSLAVVLVIVPLWACWPWLVVVSVPSLVPGVPGAAVRKRLVERVRKVLRVTAQRPASFLLPVVAGLLVLDALILSLAGLLPWSPRHPTWWLLVLLVPGLPLWGLVSVWRLQCAEQLVDAAGPAAAGMPAAPDQPVTARSLNLGRDELAPGKRERALRDAVRSGEVERAMALLAAGAEPDARPEDDPDQRSLLALACLLPDARLARALIARGVSVDGDGSGLAPLLIAVRDGHHNRSDAVMTLLANGADVSCRDAECNRPLHFAALRDDPDVAAMLLDSGANIDACNQAGYTALALAARAGYRTTLDYLLERGAGVQVKGAVPALVAATDGTTDLPELVDALRTTRASIDATDVLGRTPLMHAALAGHVAMVEALLQARADVHHVDHHGTNALMEAARAGCDDALRALAEAAPDVAQRDGHGRDALMLACQSPRAGTDTVRLLLELGADARAPGKDGRTPLDHAAAAGRWNLVALLDPDTPLPAAHRGDVQPEEGADSPQDLLEALRKGHWAVVSGFATRVTEWPVATRIGLYLELLDARHAPARRWLLRHGLDAAAAGGDGRHLVSRVVEALPGSIPALHDLLDRGQSIAGRGLLAQAMARLAEAEAAPALLMRLLECDGDLFGATSDGRTPLHLAAACDWPDFLHALLARGCNPNVRDARGQTPLHHALRCPDARAGAALRQLVAYGGAPEAADGAGATPLGQALEEDRTACLYWLRWTGWRLPGRRLRAADLPRAAVAGAVDGVERLLQLGFDVDTRDAQGATALLRACGSGHVEVARVLLSADADAGLATPGGATPLTAAVTARHAPVVDLLVAHGVALDSRLPGGATALVASAALGCADIAQRLLKAGAAIAAADEAGRNALHAAAQFCFASEDSLAAQRLLDVLLAHGADAAGTDARGASALLFMLGGYERPGAACHETHLGALVPVLLGAGADVNAADARGVTALHACAMHALAGPARLLLAHGADRSAPDNHHRTPSEVARILGYIDVARELAD